MKMSDENIEKVNDKFMSAKTTGNTGGNGTAIGNRHLTEHANEPAENCAIGPSLIDKLIMARTKKEVVADEWKLRGY